MQQESITVREAFEQWVLLLPAEMREDATIVMRMTWKYRDPYIRAQRFNVAIHDYDDLFQVALLGYYQALHSYDAEKGAFVDWVRLKISNGLRDLYKFRERSIVGEMLSLLTEEDHPVIESSGYEFIDTAMTLTNFASTLMPREQRVLSYMLEGLEKTDIQRAMQPIALSTIWRDVRKIRIKLIQYAECHALTGWLRHIFTLVPELFDEKAGE